MGVLNIFRVIYIIVIYRSRTAAAKNRSGATLEATACKNGRVTDCRDEWRTRRGHRSVSHSNKYIFLSHYLKINFVVNNASHSKLITIVVSCDKL